MMPMLLLLLAAAVEKDRASSALQAAWTLQTSWCCWCMCLITGTRESPARRCSCSCCWQDMPAGQGAAVSSARTPARTSAHVGCACDSTWLSHAPITTEARRCRACCVLAATMCFSCPAHRFASESFLTGASSTQLSTKLLSLLQDCICAHLLPDLQRRLDKLKGAAVTPSSRILLKKGRRCAGLPVVRLYCHCPLFCLATRQPCHHEQAHTGPARGSGHSDNCVPWCPTAPG